MPKPSQLATCEIIEGAVPVHAHPAMAACLPTIGVQDAAQNISQRSQSSIVSDAKREEVWAATFNKPSGCVTCRSFHVVRWGLDSRCLANPCRMPSALTSCATACPPGMVQLAVDVEIGGRWSREAAQFVCLLARARAAAAPAALRATARSAKAHTTQRACATSLLEVPQRGDCHCAGPEPRQRLPAFVQPAVALQADVGGKAS